MEAMENLSVRKKYKIITFLLGLSSKLVYFRCLWIGIGSLLIGTFISILKFPGGYVFLQNSVSSIGNPLKNPTGYYFWDFGMIISGLLFIPITQYIYRALQPTANISSRVFRLFTILSSLGVVGVGIFHENQPWPHYSCATFAFFGFFFAGCWNIYTLIKRLKNKEIWPKWGQFFLLYGQMIGIMVGFLTAFCSFWLYYFWGIFWINPNLPLWEWLLFGSNMLSLTLLFIFVHNYKNES
ncbi:MAG: hypothetical protein ACTSVU_02130 [Promethearchaeota archaeon]